ncbi:hypothetical protein PTW35_18795 (plasmid) [Photobacterium sp. DA100]|uniref:hypothetical protein n=1 Tax=Photobacterium sp. DA100 TaxID=3027472 RepID=UPI00247A5643|nr:hypothetical protein [Photobacterium sp. DA100]WEM45143.1 hypothetical protein PTW35_18795 [Photobacterium sp. DA100]
MNMQKATRVNSHRSTLILIHRCAGAIALCLILTFFLSSLAVDLAGTHAQIAMVKQGILYCVGLLILAMMVTGISAKKLYPGKAKGILATKQLRMKLAAANGLLILLPAAVMLAQWSAAGQFDLWFWRLQGLELIAGATNATLLGLNIRDGLRIAKNRRV